MSEGADTVEVVCNARFGGFSLSDEANLAYCEAKNLDPAAFHGQNFIPRTDPVLVDIVRRLGARASGMCSKLVITEIPRRYAGHFTIDEYDGYETVTLDHEGYQLRYIRLALDDENLRDHEELSDRIRAILDEPAPQS